MLYTKSDAVRCAGLGHPITVIVLPGNATGPQVYKYIAKKSERNQKTSENDNGKQLQGAEFSDDSFACSPNGELMTRVHKRTVTVTGKHRKHNIEDGRKGPCIYTTPC